MNNFENTSLLHYYKDLFIEELIEFHDKNQCYGREIYRKDITGKYVKNLLIIRSYIDYRLIEVII